MIEHVQQYREAAAWLENYRRETMPIKRAVYVDCPRYTGFGMSWGRSERPDQAAVLLENGNVWHYPIECVRPTTEDERKKLPKWLKKAGAKI